MVEEIIEEEGTPAIFLRQVDVVIQNGEDEEPIVIKAPKQEEDESVEENQTEEE